MRGERNVLFEDGIEGSRDVDPFSISRQKGSYNLMMAFTTRKDLSLFDDLHHLWWEPRLRMIRNSYDDKLHTLNTS